MSLLNYFEILETKPQKLKDYLINQINSQVKWRENRSDCIEDQCNFYKTYYGKTQESNLHINKDLINDMLQESEKCHYSQFNFSTLNKTKFLEIDDIMNHELDFANANEYFLYYHDSDDNQTKVIDIQISDENELKFVDMEEFNLNFDTKIIQMSCPNSSYFNNKSLGNTSIFLDMYSLYSLSLIKDNGITISQFSKNLTFDEVPNCFLSNSLGDKIFIISKSNMETNKKTFITLVDSNYNKVTVKDITKSSFAKGSIKGDFLNQTSVFYYYYHNQAFLSDFRVHKLYYFYRHKTIVKVF
jgi:hypothetical protein